MHSDVSVAKGVLSTQGPASNLLSKLSPIHKWSGFMLRRQLLRLSSIYHIDLDDITKASWKLSLVSY
jgi:hypothetical protein